MEKKREHKSALKPKNAPKPQKNKSVSFRNFFKLRTEIPLPKYSDNKAEVDEVPKTKEDLFLEGLTQYGEEYFIEYLDEVEFYVPCSLADARAQKNFLEYTSERALLKLTQALKLLPKEAKLSEASMNKAYAIQARDALHTANLAVSNPSKTAKTKPQMSSFLPNIASWALKVSDPTQLDREVRLRVAQFLIAKNEPDKSLDYSVDALAEYEAQFSELQTEFVEITENKNDDKAVVNIPQLNSLLIKLETFMRQIEDYGDIFKSIKEKISLLSQEAEALLQKEVDKKKEASPKELLYPVPDEEEAGSSFTQDISSDSFFNQGKLSPEPSKSLSYFFSPKTLKSGQPQEMPMLPMAGEKRGPSNGYGSEEEG